MRKTQAVTTGNLGEIFMPKGGEQNPNPTAWMFFNPLLKHSFADKTVETENRLVLVGSQGREGTCPSRAREEGLWQSRSSSWLCVYLSGFETSLIV